MTPYTKHVYELPLEQEETQELISGDQSYEMGGVQRQTRHRRAKFECAQRRRDVHCTLYDHAVGELIVKRYNKNAAFANRKDSRIILEPTASLTSWNEIQTQGNMGYEGTESKFRCEYDNLRCSIGP
ncbi:hypothetical protein RB195_018284 [Necator americanus]|uniref:Uncharacterized protein n=1 Tax=Necator americanus TaxID=51031 RepID=A0ABR1C905_NECAM